MLGVDQYTSVRSPKPNKLLRPCRNSGGGRIVFIEGMDDGEPIARFDIENGVLTYFVTLSFRNELDHRNFIFGCREEVSF